MGRAGPVAVGPAGSAPSALQDALVPHHADDLVRRESEQGQLAAARIALGALRPAEREVVALCMWSGLTYAQAAEALGVPVGTIRSRLSRAKSHLQDLGGSELQAMRAATMELNQASGQGVSVCTGIAEPEKERG